MPDGSGGGAAGGGAAGGGAADWNRLADRAQQGLTQHFQSRVFGARWLHTSAPIRLAHLVTFNYWWLAHAVGVRVDGAERRGDGIGAHGGGHARVQLAERTYAGILCRNRGLFNHYFDDMGWLALAALRLFDLTGSARYLADAEALWEHIRSRGGSRTRAGAIAWRDSQLDYLNAPTNGAFAILSSRLAARTGAARYEVAADATLAFFTETFVGAQSTALADSPARTPAGPADLVADGINRLGDGALDSGWLFTYNQGLYVGALVEAFHRSAAPHLLDRATRTAAATIARLAPSGRFLDEPARLEQRGGGDAGLFKGIFVRYLELLLERLAPGSPGLRMLEPFFLANTALLAGPDAPASGAYPRCPARAAAETRSEHPDPLATRTPASPPAPEPPATEAYPPVADDWAAAPGPTTALSTQLAAVMAIEARARYERHRAAR
ncbi:hypothetical protein B7R22_10840 [Subtercola boreus]|uniref:Glycosyl hydrolase n=1 Tax=Subtercola boreus TaxID=120213 RepID=A0A3E0VWK6_9MICO|nr:glycoside hydrolase family 76 protein [Subtercola boreus]RFA14100.1 hypothetical protein B7R22_10840 [Subtercola boreus]